MVEIIKEVLYEKVFERIVDEPFSLAIDLKNSLLDFGKIEIKENKVFTTEEGSVLILKFDAVHRIDKVSKVVFSFNIETNVNRIRIEVVGMLVCVFKEEEKKFNDFYKLEIYPDVLDEAKELIKNGAEKIEKLIKK